MTVVADTCFCLQLMIYFPEKVTFTNQKQSFQSFNYDEMFAQHQNIYEWNKYLWWQFKWNQLKQMSLSMSLSQCQTVPGQSSSQYWLSVPVRKPACFVNNSCVEYLWCVKLSTCACLWRCPCSLNVHDLSACMTSNFLTWLQIYYKMRIERQNTSMCPPSCPLWVFLFFFKSL